jgi:8-oxo-dGTP pyrophosphatase MutT (NUDIX family)
MQVIHAGESIPSTIVKSIFLAGPTPRHKDTPSWRPEALRLLGEIGYDGVVFVPEARDGVRPDYVQQMQWELDAQNSSDVIVFWIPRDMATMPALTTNTEYGIWASLDPARLFVGAPDGAAHVSYQLKYAAKNDVPTFDDLAALLKAVTTSLGDGAERKSGSTQVPLHIWKTASFQNWYKAQTKAGIELHGAQVKWVLRIGAKFGLYWALKVDMFVPSENRHKTNEVVISRPDVCLTVAWHRPAGAAPEETLFALIREYRTPAVSDDGFAWENPGGSSFNPDKDPRQTAASELKQELGLEFDAARVRLHGARQIAATLSGHRAHVYSVELSAEEVAALRKLEADGASFGVASESERTYPRVRSLREINEANFVDWATIGILTTVLAETLRV